VGYVSRELGIVVARHANWGMFHLRVEIAQTLAQMQDFQHASSPSDLRFEIAIQHPQKYKLSQCTSEQWKALMRQPRCVRRELDLFWASPDDQLLVSNMGFHWKLRHSNLEQRHAAPVL